MSSRPEIVITGLGAVCPIGIGVEDVWTALREQRTGIGRITSCDVNGSPVHLAGEVREFEPKLYVRPRKSLKVMTRPMQFGVTAARLAWEQAGLEQADVDPDRVGVLFGADNICTPIEDAAFSYYGSVKDGVCDMGDWQLRTQEKSYPLGMLKTLPNLVACHVSISLDARGPNNTHHHGDISSLLAISEAMRVIERGAADVIVAGGASSLTDAYDWARTLAFEDLSAANGEGASPRPFDLDRDGQVRGEGAGVLILENRRHAQARGAAILARLLGYGAAADVHLGRGTHGSKSLVRAMDAALRDAGVSPGDVGHLNAHGLGTISGDREEASAIGQVFNGVAVTAPKSFLGNLAAASGAVEMIVSVLGLEHGEVPVTINHQRPDPACPLNVVHDEPLRGARSIAMAVNQTQIGQAAAIVLARE